MNQDVRRCGSPAPARLTGAVAPADPPRRVTGQQVIRGTAVGFMAAILLITGAGTAGAGAAGGPALGTDDRSAGLPVAQPGQFTERSALLPSRADVAAGEATVRAAMERDLGVSGAALDELLADSSAATTLDAELRSRLGSTYAGSWFEQDSGSLVVAVTNPAAAALARSAGAQTRLVGRGERELTAIVDALDARAAADPTATVGMYSWGIDSATNTVVVSVQEGLVGTVASRLAGYGDAVRVEESPAAPRLTVRHPFLDGGIAYDSSLGRCSTGFNLRSQGGIGYVLTAGHCSNGPGGVGMSTFHTLGGLGPSISIGHFSDSFFPLGYDDALIRVTNNTYWVQGPWAWVYNGAVPIGGWTSPTVGVPVCKSGRTTGFTCGVVTALNRTVNYVDENNQPIGAVARLTQHTACSEPGDSGGANATVIAPGGLIIRLFAAGVSSGGALSPGRLCLKKVGIENVSWYFPISESLPYYNSTRFVNLLTG